MTIAKGDLRVGEAVPNLYADADGAESTHWYHTRCAAYRRPEAFLQAIQAPAAESVDDRDALIATARLGVNHPRLPRLDQIGRAPSGRASCRACRTPIAHGAWRISLLFWQDGRFSPAGYIHLTCSTAYLETPLPTPDLLARLRYFTPSLTDDDALALGRVLDAPT